MTAIEVLVATLLASLMLGAVVGLLGGLSRQARALRSTSTTPAWHQQIARQLRWDLTNAREIAASPSGVRLVGFAGRDFVTDRPTGLPTAVDYYLVEAARDRWLVRSETHLDQYTNSRQRTEILARGVNRFQWGTVTVDQLSAVSTQPLDENRERTTIPARTTVQIYGADMSAPFFDEVFLLR